MKILFIAYYFEPFKGVGAKRISYWAKNLKRVDSSIETCNVITAMEQNKKDNYEYIDNIYSVNNKNSSLFGKVFKFDVGASWLYNLRIFLKEHLKTYTYDFVVITGNPFMHFFIIDEFKKNNIKTVLDFRDPFATNPRGIKLDTFMKKTKNFILKKIEGYFIKYADKIITVNGYCVELLENSIIYREKIYIIDNGYDEQTFSNLNTLNSKVMDKNLKLTYAGKLYKDRNPLVFIKIIKDSKSLSFYHIGESSEYLNSQIKNVFLLGNRDYQETLELMNKMDVCLIFTSGHKFESTTKIFDYMALNKIILIITDGEIKTGQLYNIVKNYPKVFWSKNNNESIQKSLEEIKNIINDIIEYDSHPFSRESGLKELLRILKES